MQYLTSNHTNKPNRSTYGNGTIETQILIDREDWATLEANDIYRHDTVAGHAPLGYTDWTLADGVYSREPAGTQADRDAALAAQQAAEVEAIAVEQATQRADEMARVQATDAALDTMSDDDLAVMTYVYPAWNGDGITVDVDQKVRHDGILYRVVQAHTTQPDWPPDTTPALFTRYRDASTPAEPWVQPAGAHDAYQVGDQVTYDGSTWESTAAANVWAPGVYGWVVIT